MKTTTNEFAIKTNNHGEVVQVGRSAIETPPVRYRPERKTKWFDDNKLLKKLDIK